MLTVICTDFVLCGMTDTRIILYLHGHKCPYWRFLCFHCISWMWISITQLILTAKGWEIGGPSGQTNLHPPRLIEQISYEQLLPVKVTRFHFIATDKRSDSICILQLSAVLKLTDSYFQYIMTNIITLTSLFMDSANRQAHTLCQVSITYSRGLLVSVSAWLLGLCHLQNK